MQQNWSSIAKLIDHALLNPSLTTMQLEDGIRQATRFEVASVCIVPFYTKRCAEMLQGSSVKTGTTIGFPHGAQPTLVKIAESKQAIENGAEELDVVVNINQVVSERWNYVAEEVREITDLAHSKNVRIKVIFENYYLTTDQKVRLCGICAEASVDWVKTSTGFAPGGATLEDVKLMRRHSPSSVQIKAAGGIRDLESLLAFHSAGASRIGCSQTASIFSEFQQRQR